MGSFHAKHSSASVLLHLCILSIIAVVVICGHHFDSPVIISDSKQDRYSPVWIPVVQPEEVEVGASECADWDDPITCQLEELLLSYLQAIFRSAIKQVAEHGYTSEGDPFSALGYEKSADSSSPQLSSEANSSETILPNPNEANSSKPLPAYAQSNPPETLKFGSFRIHSNNTYSHAPEETSTSEEKSSAGPCKSIYSTERRFIHEMEMENVYRTRDPDEALVYFLPFSVVMSVQYLYVADSHDTQPIK